MLSWVTVPRRRDLVVVALALLQLACRGDRSQARTPVVAWRSLGSWSGRGSMQTDPFISDTGSLRLRWATMNEAAPGRGSLRVTVHSDVSGRPLILAVDTHGVGHGTVYVTEDPRQFFLAVESANVDWNVSADEGVAATAAPAAGRPSPRSPATARGWSLKTMRFGRIFASILSSLSSSFRLGADDIRRSGHA